jgi:hypothetical protein
MLTNAGSVGASRYWISVAQSLPPFLLQPTQFRHRATQTSNKMRFVLDDRLKRRPIGRIAIQSKFLRIFKGFLRSIVDFGDLRLVLKPDHVFKPPQIERGELRL